MSLLSLEVHKAKEIFTHMIGQVQSKYIFYYSCSIIRTLRNSDTFHSLKLFLQVLTFRPKMFSFSSPVFVLRNEKLKMDRYHSSCGLIVGKNGQKVVAIVGGYTKKGMELWNPRSKSVELLWDVVPPELGASQSINSGSMLTIKGGTEFIYYGGYHGKSYDGIWKYVALYNNWTKYQIYFSTFQHLLMRL